VKTQNQKIDQKGSAAVEFAIILPFLVLLTFGIIEFSILFYNKAMVTNASREGARAGIVLADPRVSDTEIETVVTNYCGSYLITFGSDGSSPTVAVYRSGPGGGTAAGDSLKVTVTYPYDFLVVPDVLAAFFGGSSLEEPFNLSAVTVMRME
jgi:Flp pilus assembly protein TadG